MLSDANHQNVVQVNNNNFWGQWFKNSTMLRSLRKGTSTACPLPERMNSSAHIHIPCDLLSVQGRYSKTTCFWRFLGKQPLNGKMSKFGFNKIEDLLNACVLTKFGKNLWSSDQNDASYTSPKITVFRPTNPEHWGDSTKKFTGLLFPASAHLPSFIQIDPVSEEICAKISSSIITT